MTNVYKKEFYVGGEKVKVGILSTNPDETWLINELDNILCEKCQNIDGQLILNNEFFSLAVRKVKEILNYQNEKADNEENPVYYKFYRDGGTMVRYGWCDNSYSICDVIRTGGTRHVRIADKI